jgi:hypothetical protein
MQAVIPMKSLSLSTRNFILTALKKVGIDDERIQALNHGADLYGPQGLVDSVHLVSLIAEVGEEVELITGNSDSFFDILDQNVFENFKNIHHLEQLLCEKFSNVFLPSR